MLRFHLQCCAHTRHRLLFPSSEFMVMASSMDLFRTKFLSVPLIYTPSLSLQTQELFHSRRLLFSNNSSKPNSDSRIICVRNSRYSYAARPTVPPPVSLEGSTLLSARLSVLKIKLKELGFENHEYTPGQYNNLLCPMCKGGNSGENSLALHISEDGNNATWICFCAKCGWQGNTTVDMAFADDGSSYVKFFHPTKIIKKKELTKRGLELEPLCDELLAYLEARNISEETLRRNYVMQRNYGGQIVIAFTYRRNGSLVSCNYRDVAKIFWQELDTENIFYGLDDIKNASDIIIVEGEFDKLAMEEIGFRNCVSVPDGVPPKVSAKDVLARDEDTKYQYLRNCKEYFEKASRIILATNGDPPGQALAEEIAGHLGRERCWRIKWPKKNKVDFFKDANEVLMYLGPGSLKQTIENAELFPIRVLTKKLKELDFEDREYMPGKYNNLLCPMAFVEAQSGKFKQPIKLKRKLIERDLELEPLCDKQLAYFADINISAQTLRRNYVMQKNYGSEIVIAFTYRRNGALVSCKYRSVTHKRFRQEADTEKIFYGLDDIKSVSDIIIVEGEIDKLSMEEAGFRNCVSVPDGAPHKVSAKDVPAPDKDRAFQYLWNCKEYFEKASRIILATDGDHPGQALAEEIARRIGRERCWRVKWPKKNEVDSLKDANEVLMCLGRGSLRKTIENAEPFSYS